MLHRSCKLRRTSVADFDDALDKKLHPQFQHQPFSYLCGMIYFCLSFLVFFISCDRKVVHINHETSSIENDTLRITKEYIMGQFDPAAHPDFVEIPIKYADQKGRLIRKDVLAAFEKMYAKAKLEGITLIIKSATRNFEAQKKIWEDKWFGRRILEDGTNAWKDIKKKEQRALKILEYSSMPGTSRHHWGTDIDMNAFNNSYFEKGEGLKVYIWLQKNAVDFGFCQTYTTFDNLRTTGYQAEKWHWSFKPVSDPLTNWAKNHLKDTMITDFAGSDTAPKIKIVQHYVLGIHPTCYDIKQ